MTPTVLLERTDGLLEKLYRLLPVPDLTLLFDATDLNDYAAQSPIWLGAASSEAIIEAVRREPGQWPGLIIESAAAPSVLLGHLRSILFVRFNGERKAVLRYSNPTTASYFFTLGDPSLTTAWLGPVARLGWHGGTWPDQAQGTRRWFSVSNPAAVAWKPPTERRERHLHALQVEALQRQRQDHALFQWWSTQGGLSFADALGFLDEVRDRNWADADELATYLTLRAARHTEALT